MVLKANVPRIFYFFAFSTGQLSKNGTQIWKTQIYSLAVRAFSYLPRCTAIGIMSHLKKSKRTKKKKNTIPGTASLDDIYATIEVEFPDQISNGEYKSNVSNRCVNLGYDPRFTLSVSSGASELQGKREYMEDRHITFDDLTIEMKEVPSPSFKYSYWAVYDGHAGSRASEFCKNNLHKEIVNNKNFKKGDISLAIQEGIARTDKLVVAKGIAEDWSEGSCVSVVILMDNILYSANLGDSHIIITRNIQRIEAIGLTEAHKASNTLEKKRITDAGGMVVKGRIFGDLAVSRAIGDLNYKIPKQSVNYVSCTPFTKRVILTQNNHFILLASDGLWDTMSYLEVAAMLYENKEMSSIEMSEMLANETYKRGSQDNITVIVVRLEWTNKDDDCCWSDPL